MKRFHEIAVVKDRQDEIKGFILGAEEDVIDISKFNYNKYRYVDMSTFYEYVRGGQVQYFRHDDVSGVVIGYTEEEVAHLKKIGGKAMLSIAERNATFADYIKNDVTFGYEHILIQEHHDAIAGSLVKVTKVPIVGNIYTIMLLGKDGYISRMESNISTYNKAIQRQINFVRKNDNNAVLMISAEVYKDIASTLGLLTYVNTAERDRPSGVTGMMYTPRERFIEVKPDIDYMNTLVASTLI